MKRLMVSTIAVGCVTFLASAALGVCTATINNAGGSGNTVTIDPSVNPNFSIDVNLSVSPETILSAEMKLIANMSGVVSIVSGAYGPQWDPNTTYSAHPIPVGGVNPKSGFFGSIPLSNPPQLTGNTRLITLDLSVATSAPPGNYTLNLTDFAIGDAFTYEDIGATPGPNFTLTVAGGVVPTIASAVSRKAHGSAGNMDIDLLHALPGGVIAVEDRQGGPTKVLVTFSDAIQGVGGLDPSDVALASTGAQAGTISNVSISGNQLTVDLSGASNNARWKMSFPGIAAAGNASLVVTETICCGVLTGDVTGDGKVNVFDMLQTRNNLNQSVTTANFRADVKNDGGLNVQDLLAIKLNLNLVLPANCP